ncbi:MAG: flagellar hook-basal body complex protein FliE [Rickettsiales bacterium]
MDARFSQAAGAYQDAFRAAQRILEQTSSAAPDSRRAPNIGDTSFLDYVSDSLKSAAASGYKSEVTATKALTGKADLTDVVTAVAGAETALNTVVAIRDKVISAYQDIIKMPI